MYCNALLENSVVGVGNPCEPSPVEGYLHMKTQPLQRSSALFGLQAIRHLTKLGFIALY